MGSIFLGTQVLGHNTVKPLEEGRVLCMFLVGGVPLGGELEECRWDSETLFKPGLADFATLY